MSSPTNVETRWPPIRARGCAGHALGEPSTVTIDVAKGIATSGKAALAENASMPAIATAPPVAPARIASNLVLSHMQSKGMQSLEQHGGYNPPSNPNTRARRRVPRPKVRSLDRAAGFETIYVPVTPQLASGILIRSTSETDLLPFVAISSTTFPGSLPCLADAG